MSELLSFIGSKSFEEVKKAAKELNLEVKSIENIYMFIFTDKSCLDDPRVRQATGMILEKETNKLLHFSFEKCYDGFDEDWANISNDPYNLSKLKQLQYKVEVFFEGSIIKLFFYNDKWNIATSKHIEGHKNKWSSKKTYDILFAEAIEKTYDTDIDSFYKSLEKNYCHTFLLQHPENVLTHPIGVAVVYYLNKVNLSTIQEEQPENDNFVVNKTVEEVISDNKQNYMIYVNNENGKLDRIKCLTPSYRETMKLRGEYPDIGLSYLANTNQKYLFYKHFPQSIDKFDSIDILLTASVSSIDFLYKNNKVRKEHTNIPKRYIKTIVQLHGQYIKTRIPITKNEVRSKLLSLEPKTLAYVIGYKY
jgi:hypothetical protein